MYTVFGLIFYLICPLGMHNSHLGPILNAGLHTFQRTSRQSLLAINKKHDAFKIYIFYPKLFFFFFPALVFSLLFIKPQDTHAVYSFFFSLQNLLSNSMFSQGQTAAFTFYGNCRYETQNDQYLAKTGPKKRLKVFECMTVVIY